MTIKLSTVEPKAVDKMLKSLKVANINAALQGIKVALADLAKGQFQQAGSHAISAAIIAAVSYRQNPDAAARVIRAAHGIIGNSIRGVMARSV
jgi:hypothetical protein